MKENRTIGGQIGAPGFRTNLVHRIPAKPRRISVSEGSTLLVTDATQFVNTKKQWNMEHRISVLFYARNSKKNSAGLSPLYIRITVNGQRLDQSIQRYVAANLWSAPAGLVKGNTEQARQVNSYLDTLTSKVLKLEREMVLDSVPVTFANFREKWLGIAEPARMLIEIFQEHNNQMEALIRVGKDFRPGTLDRYNTCRDHVRAFIRWKYRMVDIDIKRLNFEFATDLEFWLKTERKCSHNTTMKYISNLKKIVNSCIRKGWLTKDPFIGFKTTKVEIDRQALTETELKNIRTKVFPTDRLNYVRDIFQLLYRVGLC
ncbi:MAG TPA: phage integrase SAM-like domain and Arm DNA-binding domain-containing protein [Puia sp.]|nr:phage integrase SAM-like domain and Arm DNA-binding domain-containing protein [Puia sp.]